MAATLIGVMFGLRFKIFVLIPAIAIGSAAVVGTGLGHGSSPWSILLAVLVTITVVQMGYLAGVVLAYVFATMRDRKSSSGLIEAAQRLFR